MKRNRDIPTKIKDEAFETIEKEIKEIVKRREDELKEFDYEQDEMLTGYFSGNLRATVYYNEEIFNRFLAEGEEEEEEENED